MNLLGIGQSAASGLGSAGQNFANQAGDLLTQGANVQAAGLVGATNAWTGALGDIGSNLTLQDLLSRYPPNQR